MTHQSSNIFERHCSNGSDMQEKNNKPEKKEVISFDCCTQGLVAAEEDLKNVKVF
jgi:hypothetical protein